MGPEDNRKMEIGNTLELPEGTFVVTGVQYQVNPETDERENFTYQIKDPADLIVDEPEEEE